MTRSMQYRQFTVRSALTATTAFAIALAIWKSFGTVYTVATTALAVVTIVLVRISLAGRRSTIFTVLLGASLWAYTRIGLAFFEDWTDTYTVEHHVVFCFIGGFAALLSFVYFRTEVTITSTFAFSNVVTKPRITTIAMLTALVLSFLCLPIVVWHKAMNPDANMRTYGVQGGVQVYHYWGRGFDDAMFADCSREIPLRGAHILVFRYTSLSDQSVQRLIQFPNTVALDIRGTRITYAGAKVLRDALPDCKIIH